MRKEEAFKNELMSFVLRVPEGWWKAVRDFVIYQELTEQLWEELWKERPDAPAYKICPEVKALTSILAPALFEGLQGRVTKEEFLAWFQDNADILARPPFPDIDRAFLFFFEDVYAPQVSRFLKENLPRVRAMAKALVEAGVVPSNFTSPLLELLEESAPAYVSGLRRLAEDLSRSSLVVNDKCGAVYLGQDRAGRPIFLTARHCLWEGTPALGKILAQLYRDQLILPDGEEIPVVPVLVPERDKRDSMYVALDWALLTVPEEHYARVLSSLKPAKVSLRASGEAVTFSPLWRYWDYVLLSTPAVSARHHKGPGYSGSPVATGEGVVGVVSSRYMIQPVHAFADVLEELGIAVERSPEEEEKALLNMANFCTTIDFIAQIVWTRYWDALVLVERRAEEVRQKLIKVVESTRGLPWRERALRLQEEAVKIWKKLVIEELAPYGREG